MTDPAHLSPAPGTLIAWLRHDDVQARNDGNGDRLYVDGKLVTDPEIVPTHAVVGLAHMGKRDRARAINKLRNLTD